MRVSSILPALALSTFILPSPAQPLYPVVNHSTIQLSATAHLAAIPDRARIAMAVTETATSVVAAKEAVDRRSRDVQRALTELGVDPTAINASQIMIYPHPNHHPSPIEQREFDSLPLLYSVSRQIGVEVVEIDKLDRILDQAILKGTNRLWNVELYTSAEDSLKREAILKAAAQAEEKSRELAEALGYRLDKLIVAEHEFASGGGSPHTVMIRGEGGGGDPFARGTIRISATVNTVFRVR